MGKILDSDWSRANFLRSDWLQTIVAMCTTNTGSYKLRGSDILNLLEVRSKLAPSSALA